MQLHGYSQRTIDAYVRAVRQLAEHYHKSPDQITEEELRQYFLYLEEMSMTQQKYPQMVKNRFADFLLLS
ncbi:MAG: phage integrase N-terminal SAM-like domain-containing protein [Candidatus Marinimicrobia bacterium]|nr:phage integrase N-terminal SAM-like domain-containing protein [bacterium]MCG2716831.1 phage integrase N-terminal SAM-like domain-containing protein [Candidatus Neomarinimicrobiota bacterium]